MRVIRDLWREHVGADAILNHQPDIVTDAHIDEAEKRAEFWSQQVHKRGALNAAITEAKGYQTTCYELEQQARVIKTVAGQKQRILKAGANNQIDKAKKLASVEVKAQKKLAIMDEYRALLSPGT